MKQYDILIEIQANGHNVVTCGHCGIVILVRDDQKEYTCFVCGSDGEPCDFPDLYSQLDEF